MWFSPNCAWRSFTSLFVARHFSVITKISLGPYFLLAMSYTRGGPLLLRTGNLLIAGSTTLTSFSNESLLNDLKWKKSLSSPHFSILNHTDSGIEGIYPLRRCCPFLFFSMQVFLNIFFDFNSRANSGKWWFRSHVLKSCNNWNYRNRSHSIIFMIVPSWIFLHFCHVSQV